MYCARTTARLLRATIQSDELEGAVPPGGFQFWINRFITAGALPFMVPVFTEIRPASSDSNCLPRSLRRARYWSRIADRDPRASREHLRTDLHVHPALLCKLPWPSCRLLAIFWCLGSSISYSRSASLHLCSEIPLNSCRCTPISAGVPPQPARPPLQKRDCVRLHSHRFAAVSNRSYKKGLCRPKCTIQLQLVILMFGTIYFSLKKVSAPVRCPFNAQ